MIFIYLDFHWLVGGCRWSEPNLSKAKQFVLFSVWQEALHVSNASACFLLCYFFFFSFSNPLWIRVAWFFFFSACLLLVNVVAKVTDGKLDGPGKLRKRNLTGARVPALFHLNFPIRHDSYGMLSMHLPGWTVVTCISVCWGGGGVARCVCLYSVCAKVSLHTTVMITLSMQNESSCKS